MMLQGKGNNFIERERQKYLSFLSCPHITPCPGKRGKIIFLTGPPGAGKSTTCQIMAREKGYIFMEGDSVIAFKNPFTNLDVENPTMESMLAVPLKVVTIRCHLMPKLQLK